jgi:sortase A
MSFPRRFFAAALFTAALLMTLDAAWVPAKAGLGQVLLERAWRAHATGAQARAPRPWPWADTRPVAELEIPSLGLRQLVLEGASGRNLAWGPAALTPVAQRDVVLSGHRDTHFAPLKHLSVDDTLILRDDTGERRYRVAWMDIVDSRKQELVIENDRDRLTLVTCYPFDAPTAGGPLRLVVTALPNGPAG